MAKPHPTNPKRPSLPDPPAPDTSAPTLSPRLAIAMNADKTAIDWHTMRESTREKLIDLVRHDPKFQQSASTSAPAATVPAEVVAVLYDALSTLEALIIQRIYKVTSEQAAAAKFTAAEKLALTEPTQKVLAKYAGTWLTAYGDECALLVAIGTIHLAAINRVRIEVERAQRGPVVVDFGKNNQEGDE